VDVDKSSIINPIPLIPIGYAPLTALAQVERDEKPNPLRK
jgi:hypothetical protein